MSDNPQGTQPKRRKKRRVTAPAAKDDGPVDVIQDILDSSSGDYEMSVPVLPDDSAAPPAASAPPSDIPVAPVNDNPIDDYMPSVRPLPQLLWPFVCRRPFRPSSLRCRFLHVLLCLSSYCPYISTNMLILYQFLSE